MKKILKYQGGKEMKNLMKKSAGIIAGVAMFVTMFTVNATCWMKAYQEVLPEELNDLRKFQ